MVQPSPGRSIMAIDGEFSGGGRNCGAHELICVRRVSPELLGVLSSIAALMALMALVFLYLSNKLSAQSPDSLPHLTGFTDNQRGTGERTQKGGNRCERGGKKS
ncbi:synaptotagmin-14 [Austrofundulus limnaeus]|uniref:Synaptotagmin-14 n=1 Tax=Austrofundulus limnaeus TaxID=52670 RepID=A0A2I4C623_AUSLI|nr:PREDICTED: synaptotagmin-14-like [Austrofundulus limnaeus]